MRRILLIALLVIVAAVASCKAQLSALQNYLAARETALGAMVTKVESLMSHSRCLNLVNFVPNVTSLQVPACGSTFSRESYNFTCNFGYGQDSFQCLNNGGNCSGLIRSVNKSTVLFPLGLDFNDKEAQAALSIGAQFDREAEQQRVNFKAWMGFGHYTGVARQFPGAPRNRGPGDCSAYDPRLRSWYVAAASGPADIVLVVDTSGSMATRDCSTCPTRLSLLKTSAKTLLDTFSINTRFAIVEFFTYARILTNGGSTNMLQATAQNVANAKRIIDQMVDGGGTVFSSGFEKAFDVLRQSSETSGCKRIILFLTDGEATDWTSTSTATDYLATKQDALFPRTAHIFTVSMSTSADTILPKAIACANKGIWFRVANGVSPVNALSSFYRFIAAGVDSTTPRWVEPYEDAFGLGRMTTVSRAVYDRSNPSHPIFVGAVFVDVPLTELTSYLLEGAVLSELVGRSATCPAYSGITDCLLQLLRSESSSECPAPIESLASCRTNNRVSELSKCTQGVAGGVNAMLVDPLSTSILVSQTQNKKYNDVLCCQGCARNAAHSLASSTVVVVAAVLVAVVTGF